MSSLSFGTTRRLQPGVPAPWRRVAVAGCLALALAGCSAAAATPTPTAASSVSGATATPSATATATATAVPTETPTVAPTDAPTPAPTPTPAAQKSTPTPLPALAIGLCTGAQLKLEITAWIGDPGAGTVYAHLTATNVSSASCNMRGTSEAQILNSGGSVIADAGSGQAHVTSSDTVYTLAPNGTINTITQWGNWCKAAPAQNLKVAMVEPFGLGRIVAPANGVGSVPTCYSSGTGTVVSSEAWLP
jgi:hypothetical protein